MTRRKHALELQQSNVQLISTIKTQNGQMRKIIPSFKVRQVGDAISASHLCTGGDTPPTTTTLPPHPDVHPDVQPDNSPSECYLLQKESALIAHTCDLRPHKPISPISVGTSPPSKCLHLPPPSMAIRCRLWAKNVAQAVCVSVIIATLMVESCDPIRPCGFRE